jgi:DNA-binding ferritin-like protein
MQSPSNVLSERIRAQSVELLNLADAIDQYSKAQRVHWNDREAAGYTAMHVLFDTAAPKEDYSDLMPNPPDDPTAWRGALLRRFRNANGPA